jgi:hypothetical protein
MLFILYGLLFVSGLLFCYLLGDVYFWDLFFCKGVGIVGIQLSCVGLDWDVFLEFGLLLYHLLGFRSD